MSKMGLEQYGTKNKRYNYGNLPANDIRNYSRYANNGPTNTPIKTNAPIQPVKPVTNTGGTALTPTNSTARVTAPVTKGATLQEVYGRGAKVSNNTSGTTTGNSGTTGGSVVSLAEADEVVANSKSNTGGGLENYRNLSLEDRYQNQYDQINANYDSQISDLEWSKMTSQQQADITRAQLQKYLPYYYKSRGLDGLGLEQSAMLEANANYSNQMGQIETDYMREKNALENYRTTALADKENEYYGELDRRSGTAYSEVEDALSEYAYDEDGFTNADYENAKKILEIYRDRFNDQDLKDAENLLENYRTRFGEDEEKKNSGDSLQYGGVESSDFEVTDKIKNGQDYFAVGNQKYQVDKKSEKYDLQYSFDIQKRLGKTNFASLYDSNIPNGTIIEYTRETFWGERFRKAMYLDGEWYDVEEIN